MGLSRTISEIKCNFRRKSQIFPIPVYCVSPLELGIGTWGSKN